MTETTNTDAVTCIADGRDCTGDVEYRDALSGTGVSHPRCDKHWQGRPTSQVPCGVVYLLLALLVIRANQRAANAA